MKLEDLSKKQIEQMQHALGLPRKKKPYRNRFYCSRKDPAWSDLVDKGLAQTTGGWEEGSVYFYLTYEAAKLVFTKPMSRKYFDEL